MALLAFSPEVAHGEEAASGGGWSANLWLAQEYRLRSAGAPTAVASSPLGGAPVARPVSDQDLRLTLDGTVVGLGERVAGNASLALWIDLDGHLAPGQPDLFADAQGFTRTLFVLYGLTAELRRTAPIDRLALGRQQAAHGLPVTFDGAALDLRFWQRRLTLFGYGGRTIHFFEADPGLLENWLLGGGAGFRLTPHLQLEVDSRYLHERVPVAGGDASKRVDTNSYGLALTGRFDELSGKLYARGMNRTLSHLGGSFRLLVPRAALGVDGMAVAQLVSLGEIAESESPFYSILGNSLPHARARLETWKEFPLGGKAALALAVGARFRQLLHDQATRFNRNTNAVYARGDLNDLPWPGAFASVTAEWNLPTGPSDSTTFFSVGGAAGYLSRKSRLEAGTYFQRFKINYYRDVEELTSARTVFAMASYRLWPQLEVRGRYVIEIVDRAIHSAYVTLREDF